MKITTYALILGTLVSQIACASGRRKIILDQNTSSALLDRDVTAPIQSCGNQPVSGLTHCRVMEGSSTSELLTFIGPPVKCARTDACVFIKIWDNTGKIAWGGSIPKKETSVSVTWETLLSHPTFEAQHSGLWTYNMTVTFTDAEGHERLSTAQGEIVLRVLKNTYQPLDHVVDDPNFVWSWTEGDYLFRMTTSMRTSVRKMTPEEIETYKKKKIK